MKFISAALIVVAGAAILIASQHHAATIITLNPQYSTRFAENIAAIGTGIAIAGIAGWAFCLSTDRFAAPEAKHHLPSNGK